MVMKELIRFDEETQRTFLKEVCGAVLSLRIRHVVPRPFSTEGWHRVPDNGTLTAHAERRDCVPLEGMRGSAQGLGL
jgi:hypothetical protein